MTPLRISLKSLRSAAAHRPPGYLEDVLSNAAEVSDTHAMLLPEAYAALTEKYRTGPGTELKAMLKTIGITASPGCSCNKRAQVMDRHGPDWCEEHIDEISGWLEEEAKKRKLPYVHAAGKMLIRLAIRRARKKGNKK